MLLSARTFQQAFGKLGKAPTAEWHGLRSWTELVQMDNMR